MTTPELLTFESLPITAPLTPQLLQQMLLLLKNKQWTDSFATITALRSINRYTPELGPQTVLHFLEHLGQQLHNGKSLVIKNTILLIKQVFANGRTVNVESCLVFVPYLMKRAILSTGNIKDMANEALTQFVLNCGYESSYKIVSQCCQDKNVQVAELSVKVLQKLIQTIGQNIVKLNSEILKMIMISLYTLLDGKRPNMNTQAYQVCSDNYLQLMNYSLPEQCVQKMMSIMNQKINNSNSQASKMRRTVFNRNKENTQISNNY